MRIEYLIDQVILEIDLANINSYKAREYLK